MIQLNPAAAEKALQSVLAAFPEAPFPSDAAVSTGGRWFDEDGKPHAYTNPEAEEVARFFGGRPWNEITPEELLGWRYVDVSCVLLGPRALAYYVPTFLRTFLATPLDEMAVTVLEHAARHWTPPDARTGQRWHTRTERQRGAMKDARVRDFQGFLDALTPAQKGAVAESLAVLAPPFDEPGLENPVRTALDTFWSAYLRK